MSGQEQAPPVCPRHTDRVSYVRCQRCGRPVCHECQVPAAVGVQCVDCVRQQRRTAPRARNAVGGELATGRPTVTYVVLGAIAAVFVLQFASRDEVTIQLAFVPGLSRIEPWRFLTVSLVHSTGFLAHIALNGLVLWSVGRQAEMLLGRARYIAMLVLTTFGGSVAILWLTGVDDFGVPTVGISGALFGLFGASLALEWRRGSPVLRQFAVLIGFALIGLLPGLSWSWQGHLGGLLTGTLAGLVLVVAPRRHRTAWQVAGLGALTLVLVALVLVRWATVPAGVLL